MALKQDSTDTNQLVKFLIKCGANSSLVNVDIAGLGVSLRALNALLEEDRNAMTGDPIEPYKTIFHGKFDRQYLKVAHHWNPKIVDQPNEDSRTPLHCAVIQEDVERAVYLLSFGASVRAVGKRGNSPLHLAVSKNNEALVKILLCFDADYELKNKDGQAPVEMKSTAAVAKIFTQLIKSKQSSMAADSGQDLSDIIHFKQEKAVDYQEALEPEVRSKTIRLLSLDGGGIRGLCIGLMLLRIEKETRSKKIFDYFDWIAGTSTGAIFALSLAEGFSVLDCMRFYLRLKDEVFPGTRPHDPTPLENFLKECYGNKNMDQVKNGKRVVVTTTKADTNPPKLVMLRSYEMPKLVTLSIPPSEIKMWKAARCSSAAPTYFPSVDKIYLDGGLIANNPAPDLIGDVHHYNLQREYDGKDPLTVCCLLSLGTGRLPDQKLDGIDLEVSKGSGIVSFFSNMSNVYKNIKNLGNVFMEQLATSDGAVVERSRSWAHSLNIPYYRYTPQLEEECPLNTQSNEEVIKLMWTSKLYAESRSQAEIQQIIRLLRAD
ncbi:Phospholipase A(2) [Aphelenchoides bicaudatus]|nr:Phospholipase A(2) [Aphelenchoides bicaudatus]